MKPKAKVKPGSVAPLPAGADELLGKKEVCQYLKIGDRLLCTLRSTGVFPPPDIRLGKLPRWQVSTLNRWVKSQSPNAEA